MTVVVLLPAIVDPADDVMLEDNKKPTWVVVFDGLELLTVAKLNVRGLAAAVLANETGLIADVDVAVSSVIRLTPVVIDGTAAGVDIAEVIPRDETDVEVMTTVGADINAALAFSSASFFSFSFSFSSSAC